MHYLLFILILILSGCNLIPGTNTVNTLPFNLQQLSIRSNPAANNSSPILVHLVLVREPNLLEKIRNLSGPEYFSAYSQILQDYNNYIIVQDVEILPGEPLLRLKVTYPTSPKPAGAIVFAKYSNSPDLNNRVPVGNNPNANLYLDISGLVSEDVGMNDAGGYNRTPASPNIGSGFNLGSLTSMLSPMMSAFNQNNAAPANNAQGNSAGSGNAPNLGGGLGNLSSMLGGGGLGSLFGGNQSSNASIPGSNNNLKATKPTARGRLKSPNYQRRSSPQIKKQKSPNITSFKK